MVDSEHGETDEVELLKTSEWSRWQAPAVSTEAERQQASQKARKHPSGVPQDKLLSASQLEQLREQTYREAWEQGLREGYEAGQADLVDKVQQWQNLLDAMAQPLEQFDQEVMNQLVLLSTAIARSVVEHDVRTNPSQIVDVVRRAVTVMPASSRNLRVHVHPDDAELLRETFSENSDTHWGIVENPDISRGGCEVHSDTSRVDERLETRLAKVVEDVMAGTSESSTGNEEHE